MAKKATEEKDPYPENLDGRNVPPDQANAIDDMNEDVPFRPAPTENLPEPNKGELVKPGPKKRRDGMDKAMDILDEYYEDTPKREFEHTDDW